MRSRRNVEVGASGGGGKISLAHPQLRALRAEPAERALLKAKIAGLTGHTRPRTIPEHPGGRPGLVNRTSTRQEMPCVALGREGQGRPRRVRDDRSRWLNGNGVAALGRQCGVRAGASTYGSSRGPRLRRRGMPSSTQNTSIADLLGSDGTTLQAAQEDGASCSPRPRQRSAGCNRPS